MISKIKNPKKDLRKELSQSLTPNKPIQWDAQEDLPKSLHASMALQNNTLQVRKVAKHVKRKSTPVNFAVGEEYGFSSKNDEGPETQKMRSKTEYLRVKSKGPLLSRELQESLLLGDEENEKERLKMKSPRVSFSRRLFEGKVGNQTERETSSSKTSSIQKMNEKLDQSAKIGGEIMGKLEEVQQAVGRLADAPVLREVQNEVHFKSVGQVNLISKRIILSKTFKMKDYSKMYLLSFLLIKSFKNL